ncbi:MAG: hypothetical protein Q7W30_02960 [Coriobacteriia bacterium]|nr:hypothetical protein [Coriobacteriia bacterium]
MDVPDLSRIVETYVAVASLEPLAYYDQLRRDVAPYLRDLRASGSVRWFSFLLHTRQQLSPPQDGDGYIVHVRLEPASHLDAAALIAMLPAHFEAPHPVPPLSAISGLDGDALRDEDWAQAWWVFGEGSHWLLSLLDAYAVGPPPADVLQYLHFMTNPLLLGMQSVHVPSGRQF